MPPGRRRNPAIREIRDGMIPLITPVVEDHWPRPHGGHLPVASLTQGFLSAADLLGQIRGARQQPRYMGVTLKLTENVLNTYVGWKAQVLRPAKSVPYLPDNTTPATAFNAWVDPILTDGPGNDRLAQHLTRLKFGMPGVFRGVFDTWSPGYLMFIAAVLAASAASMKPLATAARTHADTYARPRGIRAAASTGKILLPKTLWCSVTTITMNRPTLLTSLHYLQRKQTALPAFYLKAKRSVTKPGAEGLTAMFCPRMIHAWARKHRLLQVLQKRKRWKFRARRRLSRLRFPQKSPRNQRKMQKKQKRHTSTHDA